MPIKLHIEVETPLTPDEEELLAGIAVMTHAIASRNQKSDPDPEIASSEYAERVKGIAGIMGECIYTEKAVLSCVEPKGHRGPHSLRASADAGMN